MNRQAKVRTVNNYLSAESNASVYDRSMFCGACGQSITGNHSTSYMGIVGDTFAARMELDARQQREGGWASMRSMLHAGRNEYTYYRFCPWCGVEFEENWWRRDNSPAENQRVADHFKNPGWHAGDSHEFRGDGPNCMANHWLGVSGGDELCWCEPEVEPSLMGCVIKHQDRNYDEVMAAREAQRLASVAALRVWASGAEEETNRG